PLPKRVGKSRQRLNALSAQDRIFGPATLVLLVSFWLPWYSVGPFSADGLSVHGWLFIAVLDSIVLVLYVLITAFGVGDLAAQGRMSKDQLLAVLTGVNLVLVVRAFLLTRTGRLAGGRIVIVGTGNVGEAFASRALEKGRHVTVWNRTPERCGAVVAA